MDFNSIENIQNCFNIINETSKILFYSHIPTTVIAFFIGIAVLKNGDNKIASRLLFFITSIFSLWSVIDLLVWFSYDRSTLLMYAWSLYGIIYGLIFISSVYFVYSYFDNKDISISKKSILLILILPFILLTPTTYNIQGYDNVGCVAKETGIFLNYYLILGVIVVFWILAIAINRYLKSNSTSQKKQIVLMTFGIESFLILFSCVVFLVAYLVDTGYITNGDYSLDQYALLSMPIFIAFLAYLIVKFRTFNIKLIGAQAIVLGLVTLTGSKLFTVETLQSRIITFITFALSAIFGFYLIKNIKREIEARNKIEILAKKLEKANEEQADTLRFITHQVNGIFTNTKGALASIIEGQYDPIPENLREMVKNLFMIQSGGVDSVQSFLSASQVDNGNPYSMAKVNINEITLNAFKQLKLKADKKGLQMNIKFNDDNLFVNGDKTYLTNAFINVFDNAIRYTKIGTIDIELNKIENKYVQISVKDTGVGINAEDGQKLFTKYGRGKNSRSVNVDSNGIGLYLVKRILDGHNGNIWYETVEGKGTVFYIKLPLVD